MSNISAFGSFTEKAAEQSNEATKTKAGYIKFEIGVTRILRILPPLNGEDSPFVTVKQHFIKSPSGKAIVFNCPAHMANSRCPACEKRQTLINSGTSPDDRMAKDLKASPRTFARCIDVQADDNRVLEVGLSNTVVKRLNHFRLEMGVDFTDPVNGVDVAITRLDGSPWYNVDLARKERPLADSEEELADIVEQAKRIDLVEKAKVLSYDQIVGVIQKGMVASGPQTQAMPSGTQGALNGGFGMNTSDNPY